MDPHEKAVAFARGRLESIPQIQSRSHLQTGKEVESKDDDDKEEGEEKVELTIVSVALRYSASIRRLLEPATVGKPLRKWI